MRALLFLFSLLSLCSFAGTDTQLGGKLTGTQIVDKATIVGFGGTRYATSINTLVSARNYFTESAEGIVKLSTTGTTPLGNYDGGLFVSIKISYIIEENGVMSAVKTLDKVLSNKISTVSVPQTQWMSVEVNGVPQIPTSLVPNLVVEASIKTTSYALTASPNYTYTCY